MRNYGHGAFIYRQGHPALPPDASGYESEATSVAEAETEFANRVQQLFPRIMRYLVAQGEHELIGLDVTALQMSALVALLRASDPRPMGELAVDLSLTESATTRLVDRLVSMNLVRRQRDLQDRRVVRVRLSTYGGQLVNLVMERRQTQFERLAAHLAQDERASLLAGLESLLTALSAMQHEARQTSTRQRSDDPSTT